MKTSILVALAALAVVGIAVGSAAVLAAPHSTVATTQTGTPGNHYGGMMNGGNGMMGGQGGYGAHQGCMDHLYDYNYSWSYDHNYSWDRGGMMA